MKKFFAALLIAVLALSAVAFAETYTSDDISFEYDETAIMVSFEDRTEDETTVVLNNVDETWGEFYIRFYLSELEDGETFPTLDEFAEMPDTEVTQGEWNGYTDVIMYTLRSDDGIVQDFFIVPIADEDGEVEEALTIEIGTKTVEDEAEEIAMGRSDLISAVIDSLKIDD